MTIDKAIELISYLSETRCLELTPPEWDALKLGIEALKRVIDSRRHDPLYADTPLPGETTE